MPKKPTQLERTAYHEAGHAVAHYLLKGPFGEVSIIPNEKAGSLGHVAHGARPKIYYPEWDSSVRTRLWVEKQVIIYYAGGITEQRLAGRHNWRGARGDLGDAADYAMAVCGSDEETNAFVTWLWERAKNLVNNDPFFWSAAEALAAVLLNKKRLSNRQARRIIQEAIDTKLKGLTRVD